MKAARTAIALIIIFSFTVLLTTNCESKNHYGSKVLISWPKDIELSYLHDNELVFRTANGHESVFTSAELYDWCPDGERIAFTRNGDLFIGNSDGTEKRLEKNVSTWTYLQWSPDGKKLAYFKLVPKEELPQDADGSQGKFYRFMIKDLELGHDEEIGAGRIIDFCWCFDGENIIYNIGGCLDTNKNHKTFLRNINSGEEKWLFEGMGEEAYWLYSCSPVAPLLAFGIWYEKDKVGLTLLNYETNMIERRYYPELDAEYRGTATAARWSPSGNSIAVECESSTQGSSFGIIIIDLQGNIIAELSNALVYPSMPGVGSNGGALWSPDEKRIAFQREYDVKRNIDDIYIWNIDPNKNYENQEVSRITSEGDNTHVQWNPNP